jgi:esterase
MRLHVREAGSGPPVLLLHGLFGSNENLGAVARALAGAHRVIGVDLRNHGRSPHGDAMDYASLAGDVAETMDALDLASAAFVGHSLGGKTAMELALSQPQRVERLAVLDIAPVAYDRRHDEALDALVGLELEHLGSRREADAALADAVPRSAIRQFLLKNLCRGANGFEWRMPLETIAAEYGHIADAPPSHGPWAGPALFLRGDDSDYIDAAGESAIRQRFPSARIETIAGAAHWLHVDSPEVVGERLSTFLAR